MDIMYRPDNIRNMSVIAHVDHGKSTLTDSLIAKAGIIAADKVGVCSTHLMDAEKDKGITIKSTGVSLYYEIESSEQQDKKVPYLINLIDSPGHVDFSSEVTAALRVTDGALVVVDFVEGVCVQTETVLRQALAEKIKPVLMINKIDRGILELQIDGEEMYQKFQRVIESANVIISTYECPDMPEQQQVDPTEGTVAFGAALFGWAFNLKKFANKYAAKLNVKPDVMMKKLWGDNFYDDKLNKWSTEMHTEDGRVLKRSFVQYVLDPIMNVCRNCMKGDIEQVKQMCTKLNIQMTTEEFEK